jgi:hypothetical protein
VSASTSSSTAPPVLRTPVRVSITVTVGGDARSFAVEGVALDGSDPYRLADSMAGAVRDDAGIYLRDHANY